MSRSDRHGERGKAIYAMADETELIAIIRTLPTPAPILARINSIVISPTASAKEVSEILKSDPVISGKVLRLANSAFFGLAKQVSSLQHAVALLGLKRVAALVTTSLITSSLRVDPSRFDLPGFWVHSTAVGYIAESIGRHLQRYRALDVDACFSAAVLHDIGKLLALTVDPDAVRGGIIAARTTQMAYHRVEDERVQHTRLGGVLATQWHFPEDLSAVIACHHAPAQAPGPHRRLCEIVSIADCMAHSIGLGTFSGECAPEINDGVLAAVSLPLERLRVIAEHLLRRKTELESIGAVYQEPTSSIF